MAPIAKDNLVQSLSKDEAAAPAAGKTGCERQRARHRPYARWRVAASSALTWSSICAASLPRILAMSS